MNLNFKRITVFLILVVIVTGFIFYNSLQNIETSNKASGVIEEVVEPIIDKVAGGNTIDVHFLVRKSAHLIEFFALGLVVMGVVVTVDWKFTGYGLFYVLAVAVTDEYIQSFLDRTSSVKDVLIDFTGAVIGIAVYSSVVLIFSRCKKQRQTKALKGSE